MRDIDEKLWTCVRQRAGPRTIELRYQRPQTRVSDLPSVRREKNEIIRAINDRCFRRTPKDRLETALALMGWGCSIYTLTFADQFLPDSFEGVRDYWRRYVRGLNRMHGGGFPYVYVIEGLHGDHRWHVHAVLRDADVSEADVLRHWAGGKIEDVQPLLDEEHKTFRQRAHYFTKERRDGLVIPRNVQQWVAARRLYTEAPPLIRKKVRSGTIRSPKNVWSLETDDKSNSFGAYHYKTWIEFP